MNKPNGQIIGQAMLFAVEAMRRKTFQVRELSAEIGIHQHTGYRYRDEMIRLEMIREKQKAVSRAGRGAVYEWTYGQ